PPLLRCSHFSSYCYAHCHDLHSFPTRRSSDLKAALGVGPEALQRRRSIAAIRRALRLERIDADFLRRVHVVAGLRKDRRDVAGRDRKSTRLNSSHVKISYAVFCLKKKKIQKCE